MTIAGRATRRGARGCRARGEAGASVADDRHRIDRAVSASERATGAAVSEAYPRKGQALGTCQAARRVTASVLCPDWRERGSEPLGAFLAKGKRKGEERATPLSSAASAAAMEPHPAMRTDRLRSRRSTACPSSPRATPPSRARAPSGTISCGAATSGSSSGAAPRVTSPRGSSRDRSRRTRAGCAPPRWPCAAPTAM